MLLPDFLAHAAARLAHETDPRLEARWLAASVLDIPLSALQTRDAPLSASEQTALQAALQRRAAGEPLGRILGVREFWGLPFRLSPDTLEPRPDSETLIRALLEHRAGLPPAPRLLDFGTGTGCLLLAALSELRDATGIGVDKSVQACQTAALNAAALGLQNRAHFLVSDWGAALSGQFDVILTNPPYIADAVIPTLDASVRDFDPLLALSGGADGLNAYRALIPHALRLLKPGGLLLLEIGYDQADSVPALLSAALQPGRVILDYGQQPRVVLAQKSA